MSVGIKCEKWGMVLKDGKEKREERKRRKV